MKIINFNFSVLNGCDKKVFTFVNPYSYYKIESFELRDRFIYFADGILLVWLSNFLYKSRLDRFSFDFTSLAPVIFNYCETNSLKVAFVGGGEDDICKAISVIKKKHPDLLIVFSHHGYIGENWSSVITLLKAASPDVVIAGMGTPLQEKFLIACLDNVCSMKFAFTCGGFISQIATNENYFHPFFDRLHLRWLQRFFRHSYVRKRLLIDYPVFLLKFLKDKFFS